MNVELIKYDGSEVAKILMNLISAILKEDPIPKEMKLGFITPIFKREDKK